MKRLFSARWPRLLMALGLVLMLVLPWAAMASSVATAVVDATAPTGSVTLAPGGSASITINLTVTGNQEGTATFDVYRDWTLSGGTFTGSNPQTFTVPPREARDAATGFSTTGTVTVAAGQADGTFTLAIGAFNITNANKTGAKLAAGASSSYQVTVLAPPPPPSDTTPPTITASAKTADGQPYTAGTWTNQDVTVYFSCSDTGSGLASCPDPVTISAEGVTESVVGTASDKAGNTATASFGPIKVDKTPPTLTGATTTPANANGWYNSDVTIHWNAVDTGSGVASVTPNTTLSTEGAGQSATGTATDNAGNTATATVSGINIDKTAPTLTGAPTTDPNANGWYNHDVVVHFDANDGLSGIDSVTSDATLSDEGANQSVTGTATDKAGNTATATVSGINIDKTAPTITVTGIVSGGKYGMCSLPTPGFDASDALSGLDGTPSFTWNKPSSTLGIGTYTYQVTATDKAGNTTTTPLFTYYGVYGAAFSGYLQPINVDGTSRFKLGSTVPVKFKLTGCDGTPIANAIAKLYVSLNDGTPDPGTDEAISTAAATTGNLFRYDSTAGQYIFNLSTKLGYTNPDGSKVTAFSQGTWFLKILLDDNTWQVVKIQLVK